MEKKLYMPTILTYHQINPSQWQNLIETSPTATWFQTPEAYQFYQSVPDMQPFAVAIQRTNGLAGVCVGYITQTKCWLTQLMTCRAIIMGGPLIASDAIDEEVDTLLKAIHRTVPQSAIYIETRNFNSYAQWRPIFEQNNFVYQPHYDIHVKIDDAHRLSDRRLRELKKAYKNGVTIQEPLSEQQVIEWYHILQQLYKNKVRTPLPSLDFFCQFYRIGVGKYLLVTHKGKIIGGMMCPILNDKAIYEWYICGLDEEYRDLYPSVVATYASIEYAKTHNICLFDFMGAGVPGESYGVRDFKAEFGGEIVEYGRFLCVRKPLLYWLGTMGVKMLKWL